MNALFLAAGLGTRLRPLTLKYPKPCVPFLNIPLGLYQFRFLNSLKSESSLQNLVVNTFHLPQKIHALYQNQPYFNGIQFSDEHPLILGSAGGLKKASRLFSDDETILLSNADEVFFTEDHDFLSKAYQQHTKNKNLATLIVMKHPEAGKKFGAIWCEGASVRHIGKDRPTDTSLQPWHYIGMLFLNRRALNWISESQESNIFYDILIQHLGSERVEAFELSCNWYETGNAFDFFEATKTVLQNLDDHTLDFINQYDPSDLIQNKDGVSLVSKSVDISVDKLEGYNVISKSSDPHLLKSLPLIQNSVLFEHEHLNLSYFS
ncbi:sugar phosphate nucleotidyltransferase [Pseudobdellovibrio exovorus]|uniref:Mannose-1-phosphate guanyltransferase n=1 Tax=Pseudobdellovibrio exovorus JSS TaxID=1184267 RepID=M4V8N2_9BACT|nr:sugar phosphate nucleotidyltransferase [Pseudobdellovibrio exovorus]AGH94371.1 mannose-1-phosphate guanyltransferase [Pseudobdellovibrio exovorus JSS]